MGAEGNVDALLTHAPDAEQELVDSGAALTREPFMENYFVIAGPPHDPAGVRDAATPAEAYERIAAAGAAYASRGDDSGTHKRERALLAEAGLDPKGGWPAFHQTGSGMGLTLQVAGERGAYTLSDVGTFLAYQKRTGLEALSKPSPGLRNVYSVLRVNPERFAGAGNAAAAEQFAAFLRSEPIQRQIADFGAARFGRPLFRPLVHHVGAKPLKR
jgi:tungstate transport system substrate-binding protein